MCDNIQTTVRELRVKGVQTEGEPKEEGWGITVTLSSRETVECLLDQPRHPLAIDP
jgi:hypothetical protein